MFSELWRQIDVINVFRGLRLSSVGRGKCISVTNPFLNVVNFGGFLADVDLDDRQFYFCSLTELTRHKNEKQKLLILDKKYNLNLQGRA